MQIRTMLAVAALSLACSNKAAPTAAAAAPAQPAAAQPAPADANVLRGKVVETIDASQYTYLRLNTQAGEVWAAVPKAAIKAGDTVGVLGPIWMENFKSNTLGRTWERIAFGTLEGESSPQAGEQAAQMPPGHPSAGGSGAGMFAAAAASNGAAATPPGHPAPAAAADVGSVNVPKASGPQGRTIADIYAQRAQLKDKPVAVRGKVVKATNGVMGKNWLHLRDGSGDGPTADLAVASDQTAKVGDTVLVSGTVHLDRDLGAGYHYDVLVEGAKVKEE